MPLQLKHKTNQRQGTRAHNAIYRMRLYGLLSPYLAGLLILIVIPALLTLLLAFSEFDALSAPRWRGLGNFRDLLGDPLFWVAVRNTLFFVAASVPLRMLGALALALLLNRQRRGTSALRSAVYLPTIIPEISYALIWLWIFNPLYGPLNLLLGSLGLPTPAWLTDPLTAKLAFVLMSLFQIGEGFIVLLAGLQDVPAEYYQAAAVDGAGRWQLFRFVTLPFLAPWLILMSLRDLILSTQSTFIPAMIMTGGDPYYGTWFLPQMIYEQAFDRFRYGMGSALMLLLFLGIAAVLLLIYYLVRGWGYDDAV